MSTPSHSLSSLSEVQVAPVKAFEGHKDSVLCVAWYPDERRIVSGSGDGELRIWNTDTSLQVGETITGHNWEVWALDVSPDGKTIASGGEDQTVRLWDSETGQLIHTCEGHEDGVRAVHFSPDSKKVASGSEDQNLCIWDVDTGNLAYEPVKCKGDVVAVRYSLNGDRIVSGAMNIQIWQLVSGNVSLVLTIEEEVTSLAWMHDGEHIIGGGFHVVTIWNASSGERTRTWKADTEGIQLSLSTSPAQLTTCNSHRSTCETLVFDTNTGEKVAEYKCEAPVNYVAYSFSGGFIAAACYNEKVYLWETLQSPGLSILDLPATTCSAPTPVHDQIVEKWPQNPVFDSPAVSGPSARSVWPTHQAQNWRRRTLRGTLDGIFRRYSGSKQQDKGSPGPSAYGQPTRIFSSIVSHRHLPFSLKFSSPFAGASRRNSPTDPGERTREHRTREGNWVAESRTRPIYAFETGPLPDEIERGCLFHLASYLCYCRRDPNVLVPTSVNSRPISPHTLGATVTQNRGSHTYPPGPVTPTIPHANASSPNARLRVLFRKFIVFLRSHLHSEISDSTPGTTIVGPVVPTVVVSPPSSGSANEPSGATVAQPASVPLLLSTIPTVMSNCLLPALAVTSTVSTLPLPPAGPQVEPTWVFPEVLQNDLAILQSASSDSDLPLAIADDASMSPIATRTSDSPVRPTIPSPDVLNASTPLPSPHDSTHVLAPSLAFENQPASPTHAVPSDTSPFDVLALLQEYRRRRENLAGSSSSYSSHPLST